MGGDVDDLGLSRFYETVKAVDAFDLLRFGVLTHLKGKSVV